MPHKIQRYGWVPDLPDQRDFVYAAPTRALAKLPSKVDLTPQCPPVYDQGDLGSCTANAIGGAIQFEQIKGGLKDFVPSRLFIYYNERVIEHSVDSDNGAQIRNGMKVVTKQGACPEVPDWPYDIRRFRTRPSRRAYKDALKNQVVRYTRVTRDLNQMKGCLASGYPFVFGFTVYASFESQQVAKTGHLSMPKQNEDIAGGHAVLAVGYDNKKRWFIVRNSWGPRWGMKGYFTIPYAYLLDGNLSDDFWTIRMVAGTAKKKAKKK